MKNRKVREFAKPEEDPLESISNGSTDGNHANASPTAAAPSSPPALRSRPPSFRVAGQSSPELGPGTEPSFLHEPELQGQNHKQQQHEGEDQTKVEAEPSKVGNPDSILIGAAEKLLKQHLQSNQQQPMDQEQLTEAEGQGNAVTAVAGTSGGCEAGAEAKANAVTGNSADTEKKRCDKCGKKLGLTGGFPCRCGGTFCTFHRYSDRHECNFDYRKMGASEIRRDNPVIVADKLRKL
ncbi:uncharacterized protein [Drosophila bipectinata]|uniref:uncharacterized protein n=1 Tax=Drosophila bipectinata TaxID=42026 RepID=UPI001C8AF261|nr:zinc finger A20 and AN1 domain-containing stress-associated protein 1 [Drosophila bipectinata]XP_043068960.1 zinc finger A20 and AN1 domain-containing stress-associated protein 1 [Drosophila bipectinata]